MRTVETLVKNSPICPAVYRKAKDYFKDEGHKREFGKWYKQKYGKEYEWKKHEEI